MTDEKPAGRRDAGKIPLDKEIARLLSRALPPSDETSGATIEPMEPLGNTINLEAADAWVDLYKRIRNQRPKTSNARAWRRCLALMRHSGAKALILEDHYVCLEYRSEFIAFYAHVDKALPTVTQRMHFFSAPYREGMLGSLTSDEIESYLGYIVVRPADLPIVGRAHLAVPDFVSMSTAVEDHVHLFGQRLAVKGVPFMEQESRLAQCGNVALWMIHHSAFLRGIFERRFIADFVDMPGRRWPMRVSSPNGMTSIDAAKILDDAGFHSEWKNQRSRWLTPPLPWADLVPSIALTTEKDSAEAQKRVRDFRRPNDLVGKIFNDLTGSESRITDEQLHALDVYDNALTQQILPHIRSGFPVYVETYNHALIACGFDKNDDIMIHDDQYGPYLTARRLATLSAAEVQTQIPPINADGDVFKDDTSFSTWWEESRKKTNRDVPSALAIDRPALDVIFAEPPRVFQRLGAVRESGLRRLLSVFRVLLTDRRLDTPEIFGDLFRSGSSFGDSAEKWGDSTLLVKGITYKGLARKRLRESDNPLVKAMSWVQLSEWVVVVELLTADAPRYGIAEVVYDASSDPENPRMLVLRIGRHILLRQPSDMAWAASSSVENVKAFMDVLAQHGITAKL